MKPIDRQAQKLKDHFKDAATEPHTLERDVREAKRQWKKFYSKHLRRQGKKNLKKELDGE
jgi:hypothetical protein